MSCAQLRLNHDLILWMTSLHPAYHYPAASRNLMSPTSLHVEPKPYRESHVRTLLKTMTWRIVATTTTVIIAFFVFGNISGALVVGSIEFFAKMIIYYLHERTWQLVPRGSVRHWFEKSKT